MPERAGPSGSHPMGWLGEARWSTSRFHQGEMTSAIEPEVDRSQSNVSPSGRTTLEAPKGARHRRDSMHERFGKTALNAFQTWNSRENPSPREDRAGQSRDAGSLQRTRTRMKALRSKGMTETWEHGSARWNLRGRSRTRSGGQGEDILLNDEKARAGASWREAEESFRGHTESGTGEHQRRLRARENLRRVTTPRGRPGDRAAPHGRIFGSERVETGGCRQPLRRGRNGASSDATT